ncbi:hypothetical protein BSKO_11382 [Bryopsis sp. KO-2023]|nr:hypothetical protein BSKO_11382 [Bryopsis sp. KO-2023]
MPMNSHSTILDVTFVWQSENVTVTPQWSLYGLCDGHGGSKAATFVKDNIVLELQKRLPEWIPESWSSPEVAEFAFSVMEAVSEAIQTMEKKWRTSAMTDHSGSTITLALRCDRFLTVANVGDSSAFLDCGGSIHPVTHSHRLEDNPFEVQRLRDAGITIARVRGTYELEPALPDETGIGALRVWPGGLAMGRSFGDVDAPRPVTAQPHIKQMVIPEEGARLYLGSDGVWDVLNATAITRSCRHQVPQQASHLIMDRIILGSGGCPIDDATIVVADMLPESTRKDFLGASKPAPRKKRFKRRMFSKSGKNPFDFLCEIDSIDIRPLPARVDSSAPVRIQPKSSIGRHLHCSATSLDIFHTPRKDTFMEEEEEGEEKIGIHADSL